MNVIQHQLSRALSCIVLSFFMSTPVVAAATNTAKDVHDVLANAYFDAWIKSQGPSASEQDIDHYTSFLTDDAVWQHLPYAISDKREKGGRKKIKKGMMRWLGSHQLYKAKLLRLQASETFIMIEFTSSGVLKNSDGELQLSAKHYIDILELAGGKVATVRRYDVK